MAANGTSRLQNFEITQCPICRVTFKEPKALPCIHTFCLQCLDKHCKNKKQEEIACPLCNKVFTIPPGGNINLPNNSAILSVLRSKTVMENEAKKKYHGREKCDLCECVATMSCVICDEIYCAECQIRHRKLTCTENHELVPVNSLEWSGKRRKLSENYCNLHPSEQKSFTCEDCIDVVMCRICFAENHSGHQSMDVKKLSDFRKQLTRDIENLSKCTKKKREILKEIENSESVFIGKIAEKKTDIISKYDHYSSALESQRDKLMEELDKYNDKILEEVQTKKTGIREHLRMTESFTTNIQKTMDKGTAREISQTAHDLHTRAEELVNTLGERYTPGFSQIEITLKPSLSNVIGELAYIEHGEKFDFVKFFKQSVLLGIIESTRNSVLGVATLGEEIFVLRRSQLDVYNSNDFCLTRNLPITGSMNPTGLVVCTFNKCLYMNDPKQSKFYVLKYDLTNNISSELLVRERCFYLSITPSHNFLATFLMLQRINEYTTQGVFVREICLDLALIRPLMCVELSHRTYVLPHISYHSHRVCIVDKHGRIIKRHGTLRGSGVGQLNIPCFVAVDDHDNVLVCDRLNKSIKLLSPNLMYLRNVVLPGFENIEPTILHIDKQKNRIYIADSITKHTCEHTGECVGGRVFVLDVPVDIETVQI